MLATHNFVLDDFSHITSLPHSDHQHWHGQRPKLPNLQTHPPLLDPYRVYTLSSHVCLALSIATLHNHDAVDSNILLCYIYFSFETDRGCSSVVSKQRASASTARFNQFYRSAWYPQSDGADRVRHGHQLEHAVRPSIQPSLSLYLSISIYIIYMHSKTLTLKD